MRKKRRKRLKRQGKREVEFPFVQLKKTDKRKSKDSIKGQDKTGQAK